jgi:DNA-directed RNA polymerase subunit K/omega/FKBP-type peptidyl-prolyl cis-trans isomerase
MQKSDEPISGDEEGETSDSQSEEGSAANIKGKILGDVAENNSDDTGSETDTATEGDDTEGEDEYQDIEEGDEGEEKPSVMTGFSKLLGSLKNAVSAIGSDTGAAAAEVGEANDEPPSRRKGKSATSARAASSRKKKSRGVQPTEEELAYNSEDEGGGDDENMDDDDDESKLKKFDKELREDYLINFHPESLIQNYDEIYNLARVVRNDNGVIVDSLHRTLPMMTKYEKTRILGQRAKQINDGASPFVKVPEGVIDGYLIALKELEEKKIPFIIRRPLPNRGSEYWMVEDLEVVI